MDDSTCSDCSVISSLDCSGQGSDFDTLSPLRTEAQLPFDANSLENIILSISDHFNFRLVFENKNTCTALCVGTGLALAGTLIGRHYGGKVGAAIGGAVGGTCGIGIVVTSMRDAWSEIKAKLSELFDIVYDYLANLGIEDYYQAAMFLTHHASNQSQLGHIILQIVSSTLGKQVLSTLNSS